MSIHTRIYYIYMCDYIQPEPQQRHEVIRHHTHHHTLHPPPPPPSHSHCQWCSLDLFFPTSIFGHLTSRVSSFSSTLYCTSASAHRNTRMRLCANEKSHISVYTKQRHNSMQKTPIYARKLGTREWDLINRSMSGVETHRKKESKCVKKQVPHPHASALMTATGSQIYIVPNLHCPKSVAALVLSQPFD